MSDPLSVSAGVAGLLSLVLVVVDTTYQYISSVRKAPVVVNSFYAELKQLKAVLTRFYDLTHDTNHLLWDDPTRKESFLLCSMDMDACKCELESMQQKFQKLSTAHGASKMLNRLKWPFIEEETLQLIEKLHRYGNVFHMALGADDFAVNKKTLIEVKAFRGDIIKDAKRKSVLNWLCPQPLQTSQATIRSQRQENTGGWFLDLVKSQWLDVPAISAPVFWCQGIPGAGKTVLMSLLVDYVSSSDNPYGFRAVAAIYYNYKQKELQTTEAVLGDIIRQLLGQLPELWNPTEELFDRRSNIANQPTYNELIEIFESIEDAEHVLVAIDALDEAETSARESLLKQLVKVAKIPMRIFLTSRPDVDLRELTKHTVSVSVAASDADLRSYAYKHLHENENISDMLSGHEDGLISDLTNVLVSQASGMFLLIVFQTDYICQQTSPRELIEAAESMPLDPSAIYSRTMEQINNQPPSRAKLAKRILAWLTLAYRSITTKELVDALAVEANSLVIDPLNKRSASMLAKVCRGLVVFDRDNNTFQLAHKTIQDYLLSSNTLDLQSMQREIFTSCLTYLSLATFREPLELTFENDALRLTTYHFLEYAATYLGDHFNALPSDPVLLEQLYSFINNKNLTKFYLTLRNAATYWSQPLLHGKIKYHMYPIEMDPLHVSAVIGNTALVRLVSSRQPQLLNGFDTSGATALVWAVDAGRQDVVEILLKAGAETTDYRGETLLNFAARNRLDGIVGILIEHDILLRSRTLSLSSKEKNGRELHVAVIKGDEGQVRAILDGEVDVDAKDSDGGTPLQWAAWYGHTAMVEQLLNHGANIDAADESSGRRALHEASEKGNYDTIELLLVRGARVDAPDRWDWTPLHRAAFQGGLEAVELLLSYGANINTKAEGGWNALQLACENAQLETISLLIERGISYDGFKIDDLDFSSEISDVQREQVRSLMLDLAPQ